MEKIKTIKIIDMFKLKSDKTSSVVLSVYHKLDECDDKQIGNIYKFLYQKLEAITANVNTKNVNVANKPREEMTRYIQEKMMLLDTSLCTKSVDDDNVNGKLFINYTMDEIDKFVLVENEYCFGTSYIASGIIGNRGVVNMRGLNGLSTSDIEKVAKNIAKFYTTNDNKTNKANQQSDIFDYVTYYQGNEKRILLTALKDTLSIEKKFTNLDYEQALTLVEPLSYTEMKNF